MKNESLGALGEQINAVMEGATKPKSEAWHQAKLFAWARDKETLKLYPDLRWLFHVPNGGLRSHVVAGQMTALGVSRGVPDLILPIDSNGFVGLVAEMKSEKGKLTQEQEGWLSLFEQQGWAVHVWRTFEEARDGLIDYWSLK